jgi:hypothetical protein
MFPAGSGSSACHAVLRAGRSRYFIPRVGLSVHRSLTDPTTKKVLELAGFFFANINGAVWVILGTVSSSSKRNAGTDRLCILMLLGGRRFVEAPWVQPDADLAVWNLYAQIRIQFARANPLFAGQKS